MVLDGIAGIATRGGFGRITRLLNMNAGGELRPNALLQLPLRRPSLFDGVDRKVVR